MADSFVVENGVKLALKHHHDNPSKCHTFYNPKMTIGREFVLACNMTYCEQINNSLNPPSNIFCLDAFGGTGVSGIQWTKHIAGNVEISINDISEDCVKIIDKNCALNGLSYTSDVPQSELQSCANVPQAEEIKSSEAFEASRINITRSDANVIMHSRQFHFIYIDPFGTTVQYLDAAFHNVYNGGVVILNSTDVSALYGTCPQVLLRNYGALNVRCDYVKEVAARIVVGAAARSAARCNKGIDVLYCLAVNHFVQVAVRVKRGAQHGDASCSNIRRMIHCVKCGEWGVYSQSPDVPENAHAPLPCTCHTDFKGEKTAIELGPLWMGTIFDPCFLLGMSQKATKLQLKKCSDLLHCMLEEATIDSQQMHQSDDENTSQLCEGAKCVDELHRKLAVEHKSPKTAKNCKPQKRLECDISDTPPFYYNLHKRKLGKLNLPRYHRVLAVLREEGFRASRTHFESQAIRTDASLANLKWVIQSHFGQQNKEG